MSTQDGIYNFALRGFLTEEALDRAGRVSPKFSGIDDVKIAENLSLDLLDEERLKSAKRMAVVYSAIATFENSVRDLITKILLAEIGEDWWNQGVSEKS